MEHFSDFYVLHHLLRHLRLLELLVQWPQFRLNVGADELKQKLIQVLLQVLVLLFDVSQHVGLVLEAAEGARLLMEEPGLNVDHKFDYVLRSFT